MLLLKSPSLSSLAIAPESLNRLVSRFPIAKKETAVSPFKLISGNTASIVIFSNLPVTVSAGFPVWLFTMPSRDMTEMLLAESPFTTERLNINFDVPSPSKYVADKPLDKLRIGVPVILTGLFQVTEIGIVSPNL